MAREKIREIKFSEVNGFDGSVKEISFKLDSFEGAKFEEVLGYFRQFLLMMGYSSNFVVKILKLDNEELEMLGIDIGDLDIFNWDEIIE